LPRSRAEHRILTAELDAAGFDLLGSNPIVDGFDILGGALGIFGGYFDGVSSLFGILRNFSFELEGRRFISSLIAALHHHGAYGKARIARIEIDVPSRGHTLSRQTYFHP